MESVRSLLCLIGLLVALIGMGIADEKKLNDIQNDAVTGSDVGIKVGGPWSDSVTRSPYLLKQHLLASLPGQSLTLVDVVAFRSEPTSRFYRLDHDVGFTAGLWAIRPFSGATEKFAKLGSPAREIALAIAKIPGVIMISTPTVHGLGIEVEIGPAFTWTELEPHVLALLKKAAMKEDPGTYVSSVERAWDTIKVSLVLGEPNSRTFNVRREIYSSDIVGVGLFGPKDKVSSRRLPDEKIGPLGEKIAKDLLEVPEIAFGMISPYSVDITLKPGSDWQKVEPRIRTILQLRCVLTDSN